MISPHGLNLSLNNLFLKNNRKTWKKFLIDIAPVNYLLDVIMFQVVYNSYTCKIVMTGAGLLLI